MTTFTWPLTPSRGVDTMRGVYGPCEGGWEPVPERDLLPQHVERKGPDGLREYRRQKNRRSIGGLSAFEGDVMWTQSPVCETEAGLA